MKVSNNLVLANEWFLRAGDDELSIKAILDDQDGSPNTVCFLTQQMAEKYLKGFLVYHGKRFPKIHQLDVLVNLCRDIDSNFAGIRKEAEELSEFYIITRYPGEYPEFNFTDAKKAYQKALKVKDLVIEKIRT